MHKGARICLVNPVPIITTESINKLKCKRVWQFYNTSGECTLLFSSHGLYRVLHKPYPASEQECCLDLPNLVSLPPSWAANMSFAGQQTEPFSQIKVRLETNHATLSVA